MMRSMVSHESAEVVEVEVDGDGIALGRNNVDSGGAGGKGLGGEVELESGARNFATAVIGADDGGCEVTGATLQFDFPAEALTSQPPSSEQMRLGWREEEKGRSFLSSLE